MLQIKTIPTCLRSGRILGWIVIGLLPWQGALVHGQEQTPIDIRADILTSVDKLPKVKFDYGHHVSLTVTNTGSPDEFATVRADVPAWAGTLTVSGTNYHLLQFHWHTPSEHTIYHEHTPMEMHLVHRSDNGSLLVVGIWIVEGDKNKELDKIFARLPQTEGTSASVSNFDLKKLLPGNLESFRYAGSLTTPPFSEGVKWIVLAEPMELSKRQIRAFEHIFDMGNTRETQPLNGRNVLTDLDHGDLNDLDDIVND